MTPENDYLSPQRRKQHCGYQSTLSQKHGGVVERQAVSSPLPQALEKQHTVRVQTERKEMQQTELESRRRVEGVLATFPVSEIFQDRKLGKTSRSCLWIYHLLKLLAG